MEEKLETIKRYINDLQEYLLDETGVPSSYIVEGLQNLREAYFQVREAEEVFTDIKEFKNI